MTDAERAVLVVYIDMVDVNGKCWPSVATVAKRSGIKVRSVYNANRLLSEKRFLDRRQTAKGKGSITYLSAPLHPDAPVHPDAVPPAPRCSTPLQPDAGDPCTGMQTEVIHRSNTLKDNNEGKPRKRGKVSISVADVPLPETLNTPEFAVAWEKLFEHRKEIGKPMTKLAAQQMLDLMEAEGVEGSIRKIELAIANGWRGVIFADSKGSHKSNGNGNGFYPTASPPKVGRINA